MLTYVLIGRHTSPLGDTFAAVRSADLRDLTVTAWVLSVLGVDLADLRAVTHGNTVAYFTTGGDRAEDTHAARLVAALGSHLTPRGPAIVIRSGDTAETATATADTIGVALDAVAAL